MEKFTKEELIEGIQTMESLIRKCEKAQEKIVPKTAQWTTLVKRIKAFRMTHSILSEKLNQILSEDSPHQQKP